VDGPEEVLQPLLAPVLVPLEVEEHVARGRLRQAPQAAVVLGLEELEQGALAPAAADLQVRLRAERPQRGGGQARDRDVRRRRGEARDGVDPRGFELQPLPAVQAGDERHVVVGAAALGAVVPPGAEVAVADRVGVGGRRHRLGLGELLLADAERLADPRGVRGEVVRGEGGMLVVAEHEVHARGAHALQALELVGVEQELEDVPRLRVPAELRVVDLVGPRPQLRRLLDADQEVREADPAVPQEARLVDDLPPLAHGGERAGGERRPVGPSSSSETTSLPAARSPATTASSWRRPRSKRSSMVGGRRSATGSPRRSRRSRYVRCSHARNRLRALGESSGSVWVAIGS
jgi:hypothetical protein